MKRTILSFENIPTPIGRWIAGFAVLALWLAGTTSAVVSPVAKTYASPTGELISSSSLTELAEEIMELRHPTGATKSVIARPADGDLVVAQAVYFAKLMGAVLILGSDTQIAEVNNQLVTYGVNEVYLFTDGTGYSPGFIAAIDPTVWSLTRFPGRFLCVDHAEISAAV